MRSSLFLLPFALSTAASTAVAQTVPVSAFRSIELRGGGTVLVRPGSAQRATIVEGSQQFTTMRVDRNGKLRIDACNARCPQNYKLRIVIDSPRVPDAAISGGGTITMAPGFAPQGNLSVAISGGGQIDARSPRVTNISAAINGGGRILTGHSSHLSAAVNGGGEIRYAGSPHVSSAVHGGGAVRRGN